MNSELNVHSVENQRILSQLVNREVVCCVSHMVSEFGRISGFESNEYYDDWMGLHVAQDWEGAFEESEYTVIEHPDGSFYVVDESEWKTITPETHSPEQIEEWIEENGEWLDADENDYQAACELVSVDPYDIEVFEHWIVSDYLASKLEERGHIVCRDFMGLTIWGRCTTGQAISLDGVMIDIAIEMEILTGQKNDWSK